MTLPVRSAAVAFAALLVMAPTARAQSDVNPELPMLGGWNGQFRSILATTTSREAGGTPGRVTGTVTLQPMRESGVDLYEVVIQISSTTPNDELEWGVSMGRCGSKLIMVENANQLPGFVTRAGGDGEIRHKAMLNLNAQQSYQVGLFRNGHAQQHMIACANLKYDDRMR
ncbi:MAG: hypothetical protein H3C62_07860 [Gemmatimonadaceae bacterium]|nr:hypothetical protein [Gemmatimonadaceae bacterium]